MLYRKKNCTMILTDLVLALSTICITEKKPWTDFELVFATFVIFHLYNTHKRAYKVLIYISSRFIQGLEYRLIANTHDLYINSSWYIWSPLSVLIFLMVLIVVVPLLFLMCGTYFCCQQPPSWFLRVLLY